ncbi:MAG: nitroreductase family protein [Bacteroidales bacterium]|nr:nitroreductase family protein [Bacteroidales bacterium]MDZ4205313.1 nitroreductase family protein [Bacteroidales bacterium]
MKNFTDLIKTRQSVRRYDPRPVEKEKLLQCLEAARLAPSASNSQPWYFVVVDDPELKNKVAGTTFDPVLTFNKFALQAPIIIVMITEKAKFITRLASKIKKRDWSLIDTGIAAEHFCLQAAELELGTCMIGWFNEKKVKELLGIPENKFIGLLITLGYPLESYHLREKSRKSFDEIVGFNRYK